MTRRELLAGVAGVMACGPRGAEPIRITMRVTGGREIEALVARLERQVTEAILIHARKATAPRAMTEC